mmetsp:Transcript_19494/g.51604  ORF Transcript_19494/g.51604 Transcript_19494/m.51604 type:complete len:102 (+) Transcript_19494:237-542(+)
MAAPVECASEALLVWDETLAAVLSFALGYLALHVAKSLSPARALRGPGGPRGQPVALKANRHPPAAPAAEPSTADKQPPIRMSSKAAGMTMPFFPASLYLL